MIKGIGRQVCLFVMSCICCWIPASAQNAVKMIQNGNQETIFMLSSTPKVTIEGEYLAVETDLDKITCDLKGGVRFEFIESDNTALEEIEAQLPVFKVNKEFIVAYNLTPLSPVNVYDVAGKSLISVKTDESGYLNISTTDLPAGVYVFNSKDKNFKFYKK